MTFRRLYWITERLLDGGAYEATGVYTSIYDLLNRGLPRHEGGLRLTIVKLDSDSDPLGRYASPAFGGLAEDLLTYVKTEEITEDQRQTLVRALESRAEAGTRSV